MIRRCTVEIANNYHFTNLNEFKFEWELLGNGIKKASGTLSDIDLQPGQKIDIHISELDDWIIYRGAYSEHRCLY